MRANFDRSLAFTLKWEGGYVNHPKDPGGATNKGITLNTLRRYMPGATVSNLKSISNDLVKRIYRDGYWNDARCDTLATGVDGAVFDYAVNSGPAAARKSLMAVLGGPDHETVKKLCARRLSIYRTFKHWVTFGKGWTNRVTQGEALWVKWALAARMDLPDVETALADEGGKASSTSKKQQGGAAASTGGAAAAPVGGEAITPDTVEPIAGWLTTSATIFMLMLAAWLLWRAYVNSRRSKAYRKAAQEVSP